MEWCFMSITSHTSSNSLGMSASALSARRGQCLTQEWPLNHRREEKVKCTGLSSVKGRAFWHFCAMQLFMKPWPSAHVERSESGGRGQHAGRCSSDWGGLTSGQMGSPGIRGLEDKGEIEGHAISSKGWREEPLATPYVGYWGHRG